MLLYLKLFVTMNIHFVTDCKWRPMSIALIITTYNWPQALDAILATVKQQSLTPQQVIIADDGSTSETAELVIGRIN